MTLDVNYTAFEFSCDPDDNGGSIFYYNNTECAGTPMYSSQSEYFDCSNQGCDEGVSMQVNVYNDSETCQGSFQVGAIFYLIETELCFVYTVNQTTISHNIDVSENGVFVNVYFGDYCNETFITAFNFTNDECDTSTNNANDFVFGTWLDETVDGSQSDSNDTSSDSDTGTDSDGSYSICNNVKGIVVLIGLLVCFFVVMA